MNITRMALVAVSFAVVGSTSLADETSDTRKAIVGKWIATSGTPGWVFPGATVEFTEKGRRSHTLPSMFTKAAKDIVDEGAYSIDGKKLSIEIKIADGNKKGEHKHTLVIKVTATRLSAKGDKGFDLELKRSK